MARILQAKFTRAGAGCLLACLCAMPAFAGQPQDAAQPTATRPVPARSAEAAPAPRKRSGFGQAMSQLTQALQDASRQAERRPRDAALPAAPATADRDAPAAADHDTVAVESPP